MPRSKRPNPNVLAPRVMQAVVAVQAAQSRLSTALTETQRTCRHEVVAQSPAYLDTGEVTRICVRCRKWAKGVVTRGGGFVPYLFDGSPLGNSMVKSDVMVKREVIVVERPDFDSLFVERPLPERTPIERVGGTR